MARLYPVLLLLATAAAAAACLRPNAVEEMLRLMVASRPSLAPEACAAEPTTSASLAPPFQGSWPAGATVVEPSSGQVVAEPVARNSGEAFAGDSRMATAPAAPAVSAPAWAPIHATSTETSQVVSLPSSYPEVGRSDPFVRPFDSAVGDMSRATDPNAARPAVPPPAEPPTGWVNVGDGAAAVNQGAVYPETSSWPEAGARPASGPAMDVAPAAAAPLTNPAAAAFAVAPPVVPVAPPAGERPSPPGSEIVIRSPVVAEVTPCEGAQILARVGSDVILASEVLPAVNETLAPYKDSVPAPQYEEQKRLLAQKFLEQHIELKRAYLDAKGTIPPEGLQKFEQEVGKQFDEEEVPKMIKRGKLASQEELEAQLAALGTSLERHKRSYVERAMASTWISEQTKRETDIPHDEILSYYEAHLDDYKRTARARWEELCVQFARHSDRRQAFDLIAAMGNQVLDGAPLADVARERSEGVTAPQGGSWSWTGRGALVSRSLDEALFSLPVGQLSPIIEDDEGYHIIRVTEREDAGITPFAEAQVAIREKIRDARKAERVKAFSERLKRQIPVWTVFDDQSPPSPSNTANTAAAPADFYAR